MRISLLAVTSMLAATLAGCGTQRVLLGTEGEHLLTAADSLSLPGRESKLQARLQGGDLLQPQSGRVVRFYENGRLFKAAQTDSDGVASVSFVPPTEGDYRFEVDVSPVGFDGVLPGRQELLVACRQADEPMVVVDLDRTVVESGFHMVLLGAPKPMPGSAALLDRMAETHSIIYLTHRPDYFGPKSKAWLKSHSFPTGPVLLASVSGFLKGSGEFKGQMLAEMTKRFSKIKIGIGDKASDADAYWRNGLKSFLILQTPQEDDPAVLVSLADSLAALSDEVQVVDSWDQIGKALYGGGSFPRSVAEGRLRDMAKAAEAKLQAAKGSHVSQATQPGGSR